MAQTERQGSSRRRPPQRPLLLRIGIVLYKILVILSALIVGAYLIWKLMIKTPEIQTNVSSQSVQSQSTLSDSSDPDISAPHSDSTQPTRRKGVYTFVLLGKDRESGNTDTIIMVTYDTKEQKVGMVSVPRDTIVRRTWSKNPKINGAYALQGPDTLKQELEQTFGVPIDYYIWINLKGFIALVDYLQGVDVYIPEDMNYDDPYQDLHIHYKAGQHHLNGQQAMEVIRFRHNNDSDGGGGYNDDGRTNMQRQVLVALAKKVLSWNSLTKVQGFLDIFQTYVKTDLTTQEMLYFASQAVGLDLDNGLHQGKLEGRGDGIYRGWKWCYVFKPEDILPTLNECLNPYNKDLTAEDLDLIVPDRYYFK